jgi:ATP-dependent exoDNAse (exonuclease V) beta subunit
LQFCDFGRAERLGAAEELERLIEKGYMPKSSRELVFIDELERFFETELYSKIKTAKKVVREQRFNILLPPSMFSKDDEFISSLGDEMLAVQGVIDLVIIDAADKLCLYDYKTDRLTKAELENEVFMAKTMRQRHSEQLSYYKLAISKLFERECDVAEIYSTHAAKTVKI